MIHANILCSLEPCLGIFTACLPVLQPALAKIIGGCPLEWTRRSMTSARSITTSTTLCYPKWPSKTTTSNSTWPQSRATVRTKSSATNATWPRTNERRAVRFKDVEWGDYLPARSQRVNTIPMSTFHCAGAERSRDLAVELVRLEAARDEAVSPLTQVVARTEETHQRNESSVSTQYWD